MGIDTDRVYRLTFAIGIACRRRRRRAGGAALHPSIRRRASSSCCSPYVVVVLGGLGDMFGAMLGSLIVALGRGRWARTSSERPGKRVFYFILFILVLVFRPAGLFGQRGPKPWASEHDRPPAPSGAVALFRLRGLDTAGRPRRLLPRQPRADSPVGRAVGGLERGRRLRGPGLDRPRVVLRHRRVRGGPDGHRFGRGPWLGMLVGVVLSLRAGFIIGFLSNRLKGPYFALSTIAFSQVLLIGVSRWRGFTSGGEGIPVPFRPGFATLGLRHVAWVYMALAAALLLASRVEVYLRRSRIGYRRRRRARGRGRGGGDRDSHPAAQGRSRSPLSAALTSVCGSLWAQYIGFVDPTSRVLRRPLRPVRPQRHHRRHGHGARALHSARS